MDEAKLGRAIVLTQLVLLALCAARADADLRRGPLTIEGGVAVALLIGFAMSLVAKVIAGAIGRSRTRAIHRTAAQRKSVDLQPRRRQSRI